MKTIVFIVALAAGTIVAVCLVQQRKLADQKQQIAFAEQALQQNAAEIEKLHAAEEHSKAQRDALLHKTDILTAELQKPKLPPPPPVAPPPVEPSAPTEPAKPAADAGFGKVLAKMMQDPEMKKMMRAQQKMMVDQLYSPLAKKLGLTPDETDQFKNLVADNMMKGTEKATSLFGDGASTNRAEAIQSMADGQKDLDEQMKNLLGDARYAEYKDYQETVGERTQLNLFRQQNSGDNAITEQQTEALLALMKQEKQNSSALGASVFSNTQDPSKLQEMLAGGQTDKMLQTQQDMNQRIYDGAKNVLTPAQLDSFGTFQTNQLQMMRMGMSMAKKMFSSDSDSAAAPPVNAQVIIKTQ